MYARPAYPVARGRTYRGGGGKPAAIPAAFGCGIPFCAGGGNATGPPMGAAAAAAGGGKPKPACEGGGANACWGGAAPTNGGATTAAGATACCIGAVPGIGSPGGTVVGIVGIPGRPPLGAPGKPPPGIPGSPPVPPGSAPTPGFCAALIFAGQRLRGTPPGPGCCASSHSAARGPCPDPGAHRAAIVGVRLGLEVNVGAREHARRILEGALRCFHRAVDRAHEAAPQPPRILRGLRRIRHELRDLLAHGVGVTQLYRHDDRELAVVVAHLLGDDLPQ